MKLLLGFAAGLAVGYAASRIMEARAQGKTDVLGWPRVLQPVYKLTWAKMADSTTAPQSTGGSLISLLKPPLVIKSN